MTNKVITPPTVTVLSTSDTGANIQVNAPLVVSVLDVDYTLKLGNGSVYDMNKTGAFQNVPPNSYNVVYGYNLAGVPIVSQIKAIVIQKTGANTAKNDTTKNNLTDNGKNVIPSTPQTVATTSGISTPILLVTGLGIILLLKK